MVTERVFLSASIMIGNWVCAVIPFSSIENLLSTELILRLFVSARASTSTRSSFEFVTLGVVNSILPFATVIFSAMDFTFMVESPRTCQTIWPLEFTVTKAAEIELATRQKTLETSKEEKINFLITIHSSKELKFIQKYITMYPIMEIIIEAEKNVVFPESTHWQEETRTFIISSDGSRKVSYRALVRMHNGVKISLLPNGEIDYEVFSDVSDEEGNEMIDKAKDDLLELLPF